MSLYNELKRRNIFRVAAAYVVVGWLILQVAEIVLGFIGAPEWVGKALIALLLLGFVPVLAIAWVFEVSPEGIRRDDGTNARDASPQARRLDVITLSAVVLVVILLAWQHLGSALKGPQQETSNVTEPPAAAVPAEPVQEQPRRPRLEPPPFEPLPGSIAVLPFTNRSAEPDTAYFVDGIHDDLLTQLARNSDLKVISRTSMMEYRDTTKNVRQIGEELGVATILEGAVQRAGKRVRINAQLIDTGTDAHLWADTFDRELTPENVFDIQSEIALAIARALGIALGSGELTDAGPAAPTSDGEAYDLFLKARANRDVVTEPQIRERIMLYRQALARDDQFALAMAELGREYTNLFWYISRRDEDREEGGRWIERAITTAPDDAQVRLARAEFLYRAHLDYDGALAELDRAAQGLPGSAETVELRGYILRRAGRVREMSEAIRSAVLLAPRNFTILQVAVENAWLVGDIEDAASWYSRLEALPDVPLIALSGYPEARMRILGDTEALRTFLERNFGDASDVDLATGSAAASFHARYLAGQFSTLARDLEATSVEMIEDQFDLLPIELLRGRVAWAQGDAAGAERHARAALEFLDGLLAKYPTDYRAWVSRAETLAMLGETAVAQEALEQAFAQQVPVRDVLIRSELLARAVLISALSDPPEKVAEALGEYLGLEMKYWHFDGLILHPYLKRHRDHPAFQALAAKYSRKEAGL